MPNTFIGRKYHFHSAHRNEDLNDKCYNIHGHRYEIEVLFYAPHQNEKNGVTILFADIDKEIEPIIKQLDHGFLIHTEDPLLPILQSFNVSMGTHDKPHLKLVRFPFPTSAENLSRYLFEHIEFLTGLKIKCLTFKETESSIIKIES